MKAISLAVCTAVLLLVAPVRTINSQEIASLRAGEAIRLDIGSPTSHRIQGRLVSLSADSIVLRGPTNPNSVAFSTVRSLEVKRRSGSTVARSMILGLAGGVIGGAIIGASSGTTDTGDGRITSSDKAMILSVVGGVAGLVGGTIYGFCCSSSWQSVSLPPSR